MEKNDNDANGAKCINRAMIPDKNSENVLDIIQHAG